MSVDSLGRSKVTHTEFFRVTEIIRNNLEQLQHKRKADVLAFVSEKMERGISDDTLKRALEALGVRLSFHVTRNRKDSNNDKRTIVKTLALITQGLGIDPSEQFKELFRRLVEKEYPQAVNGVPVQKIPKPSDISITR